MFRTNIFTLEKSAFNNLEILFERKQYDTKEEKIIFDRITFGLDGGNDADGRKCLCRIETNP